MEPTTEKEITLEDLLPKKDQLYEVHVMVNIATNQIHNSARGTAHQRQLLIGILHSCHVLLDEGSKWLAGMEAEEVQREEIKARKKALREKLTKYPTPSEVI